MTVSWQPAAAASAPCRPGVWVKERGRENIVRVHRAVRTFHHRARLYFEILLLF